MILRVLAWSYLRLKVWVFRLSALIAVASPKQFMMAFQAILSPPRIQTLLHTKLINLRMTIISIKNSAKVPKNFVQEKFDPQKNIEKYINYLQAMNNYQALKEFDNLINYYFNTRKITRAGFDKRCPQASAGGQYGKNHYQSLPTT